MSVFPVTLIFLFQKFSRERYVLYCLILIPFFVFVFKYYVKLRQTQSTLDNLFYNKKKYKPLNTLVSRHPGDIRHCYSEEVPGSDSSFDYKVVPGRYREALKQNKKDAYYYKAASRQSLMSNKNTSSFYLKKSTEHSTLTKRSGSSRYIELVNTNRKLHGFSAFHSTTPVYGMGFSDGKQRDKHSASRKSPSGVVLPKDGSGDSCWSTPCPVEPSRNPIYRLPLMDSKCILLESAYQKKRKGCIVIWSPSENLWETETDHAENHTTETPADRKSGHQPSAGPSSGRDVGLVSRFFGGKNNTARYRWDPYRDSGRGFYASSVRRRCPRQLLKRRYFLPS